MGHTFRQALVRQYQSWQNHNRLSNALFTSNLCLFTMGMMFFFDFLFVEDPSPFIKVRALSILALLPAYTLIFILNRLFQRSVLEKNAPLARFAESFLLLWPLFVYFIAYMVFCFSFHHEKFFIYYTGLHLGILYSTLVLYRFWKEQYFYNATLIFVGLGFYIGSPQSQKDYFLIISIASLVAWFVAFFLRREFVSNLNAKYTLFRSLVPEKIAHLLLVTDEKKDYSFAFEAKRRFTVCVCADWRNFQKLCYSKTAQEMHNLLESYYDLIVEDLEKSVPEQGYYFSWIADELFIIFYDDHDHRDVVIKNAIAFTLHLASSLFEKVQNQVSNEITFDIGVSAGVGLLGLQGPQRLKKTTIIGPVAGMAKRYEEEAKKHRKQKAFHYPAVIFDAQLEKNLKQHPFASSKGKLQEVIASTKDIQGQKVLLWTYTAHQSKTKAA
ncbi:MAG: hypothetical protein D6797_06855 [Bdellovibrio sp.]|nr:MAG: hypothetical protein D6797_06855 [Bdellovibrio sp.]